MSISHQHSSVKRTTSRSFLSPPCSWSRIEGSILYIFSIMGRWQPYQYNEKRTSQYDVPEIFNPKAVTMASRQPPSPRKKAEGPLVDFNRHPDSYLILPYGKTDAKPMNPKVKVWIKITRYIQLAFRVLTLLGAIGALLCAIFVRGAGLTEGYIIRIPVCILTMTILRKAQLTCQ